VVIFARAGFACSVQNASWPGRDGSISWNDVAESAFAVWNEQMARLKVGWTVAAPFSPTQSRDGLTEIRFGSTVYGDSFGSNALAITFEGYGIE
jgi:hypothetical protein